ncbi:MAG: DNA-processing protein DprA [Prevotella sp.]|nr:DNA-processing protein DprA [Prevotella sp.]
MNEQQLLYNIALTRIGHFSLASALYLYRTLGSGEEIYLHRNDIQDILPECSPRLLANLKDWSEPLKRAEVELEFCRDHNIRVLCLGDDNYPKRLEDCADAPVVLYYKGNANLNQSRVINIIGTRHCTMYGADFIRKFLRDLKALCPEVLVVSGLAYGVDINAHQQALAVGYDTVGVVAHGLDYLYPAAHKDVAREMVNHGGLLTEFMTCTNADKGNFVRRNRIVAGMSDACILVESAAHGGGIITAGISFDYGREVFALPGRVGDHFSEGCNNAIRENKAMLLTSAEDFVKTMGWEDDALRIEAQKKGIERQLFPDLSPEQQRIVDVLTKSNDLQLNQLSVKTGIPIGDITSFLFQMEMMGVVKPMAGGNYHLLN